MNPLPATIGASRSAVAEFVDGLEALASPHQPRAADLPDDWEGWLERMFPRAVRHPHAPHHRELWDWAWSIKHGVRPRPFVAIWPRGGGKSTAAELVVLAAAARGTRRYAIVVSSTQKQADQRVQEIGSRLESESVELHYPPLARRRVGKYGRSRGWRRNRLHTASGFVVDALGLDTASRGLKIEDRRPDLILLDDIDDKHDPKSQSEKKIETLTDTVLHLGTDSTAVLGVQNLIIGHGAFADLARDAGWLADRIVSGPVPAVEGLETEREELEDGRIRHRIVAGTATWEGMDLDACQRIIDTSDLSSFLRERQHDVLRVKGALWSRELIRDCRRDSLPDGVRLERIVVGVDPSGGGDEIGIVVAASDSAGNVWIIADYSQPGEAGPANWGRAVREACVQEEADYAVAERNFGGDMVEATINAHGDWTVPVKMVWASRGKVLRAAPVLARYQEGRVRHLGPLPELESEMTGWDPNDRNAPSPNRLDAMVFAVSELDNRPHMMVA